MLGFRSRLAAERDAARAAVVEFSQPLARELSTDRASAALALAEREHRKATKYWPAIMSRAERAHR